MKYVVMGIFLSGYGEYIAKKMTMRSYLLSLLLMTSVFASAQNSYQVRVCLVDNGVLKEVTADYNQATGEKTIIVNGVRKDFNSVYPVTGAGYAATQPWFINNELVNFSGKPFVKYGLPRVLGINEIVKAGVYKGVGVFAEPGYKGAPEVIYLPVRQGCEFQPYQRYCGIADIKKLATTKTTMQIKADLTDITGAATYNWKSDDVKIIKGQGTSTITVDISGLAEGDRIYISVLVNEKKECPVSGSTSLEVNK
jgi:hypothetical protein